MLAICAVSPTQYAASVSTDAAIAVCFAPEDALDYRVTQARLWLADAVCGPEP
jgi:hypothetical protein